MKFLWLIYPEWIFTFSFQVFPPAVVAPRQPGWRWFPRIVPKAWNHRSTVAGLLRQVDVGMKMDGCMSFMSFMSHVAGWKWWDPYNSCWLFSYDLGWYITQPTQVVSIAHVDVAKLPTFLFLEKIALQVQIMVLLGVRCGFQNVFKMCVFIWCAFDRCGKILMIFRNVFQNRMKIIIWLKTSDWPISSYMGIKQQWPVNWRGKGLQVSFKTC